MFLTSHNSSHTHKANRQTVHIQIYIDRDIDTLYIPVHKQHLFKEDAFSNSVWTLSTSYLVLGANSPNCPPNQAQGLNRTCVGDMPQTAKTAQHARFFISLSWDWTLEQTGLNTDMVQCHMCTGSISQHHFLSSGEQIHPIMNLCSSVWVEIPRN